MDETELLKNKIKDLEKEVRELKEKLSKSKKVGRKKKFKEHDIEAMKVYKFQNKSYREIAEMFNCSSSTVHNLIKIKDTKND